MTNKVLVELKIPTIDFSFEVYIPKTIYVSDAITMLLQAADELHGYKIAKSGDEVLCIIEQDIKMRENALVGDYNLKDGDHLVII